MKVTKEFHIELAGIPHNSVRLTFLPNVPWATFIPGATSIPESRVSPQNFRYDVLHLLYSV